MPETLPNGSSLCVPCGLCCDGSLFEHARLQPGEETFADTLGLTVLNLKSKHPAFRLGCHLFRGKCTIYDQTRPTVCGSFKCKLLQKYENNKIDLSEALDKVQLVRTIQAELAHLLPDTFKGVPALAEVKRQMRALTNTDVDQRREQFEFLLLAAKYEMFLRTHFLLQSRKKITTEKLPIMGEDE